MNTISLRFVVAQQALACKSADNLRQPFDVSPTARTASCKAGMIALESPPGRISARHVVHCRVDCMNSRQKNIIRILQFVLYPIAVIMLIAAAWESYRVWTGSVVEILT
jgi:hypothetical protein